MVDSVHSHSAYDGDYTLLYHVLLGSEIQTATTKERDSWCARRRSAKAGLVKLIKGQSFCKPQESCHP